ncbi:MAG: efflux RND transporter periplasmic adaptor subunit [Candidatus Tectomicrobia bacterium]|nr:efflux RND transporter periplasmic adaptor subunit [Candidatus Tectomicrobia bacterium]
MDLHNEIVSGPSQAQGKRGGFKKGLIRVFMAVGLMMIGAAGSALVFQYSPAPRSHSVTAALAPISAEPHAASGLEAEVEVMLSPEVVAQAGIKTAKAVMTESSLSIQVPGSVMANEYKEVKVTPIAGGIVTKVHVELGTTVKRAASLATLFSAELADVQTKYLSMTAMFGADHKKIQRTQQLVEIGAASRQELEEVEAVHESRATEVEAARQRLLLLGLTLEQVEALKSPGQIVSEVVVPAPIDGVITGRSANLGQVVGMGQELFVVTDLSQVWVVGDLYEQDFQTVRVGSEAVLTTPAYPDLALRGRVTYIDPRVDPQTRTTKVRVEVPNFEGRLRLGMYVTMSFTTRAGKREVVIPRTAVQTIGDRQVVFVPVSDEEGRFVRRVVQVGRSIGDFSTILSGIGPGEVVVAEGSFYLRAESIRNSLSMSM